MISIYFSSFSLGICMLKSRFILRSMDLPNRVSNPTDLVGGEQYSANEQKLQHSGKIPYFTFQVSVKANRPALAKKNNMKCMF